MILQLSSPLESQTKISSVSQGKALLSVNYFLRTRCFVDKIDKELMILSLAWGKPALTYTYYMAVQQFIIFQIFRRKWESSCSAGKIMFYSFYFSARFQYQLNEQNKNVVPKRTIMFLKPNNRGVSKFRPWTFNEVESVRWWCVQTIPTQVSYHASSWPPRPLFLHCFD